MILRDVQWTGQGNILIVECDCKRFFIWPTWISLAECPHCHQKQIWHGYGGSNKPAELDGYEFMRHELRN